MIGHYDVNQKKNRLVNEKNPYLSQHASNPVNWFPWGDEAFLIAKKENKPIFLSIGYSTCHWCHVMEAESFEDSEVADFLNRNFISIKVDREERPDVDDVYMSAVQQLSGHGGWPLSAFLLPQGKPFYGGTYFPKKTFLDLLSKITYAWKVQHKDLVNNAQILTQSISKQWEFDQKNKIDDFNSLLLFQAFEESMEKSFDPQFGGFGGAPKFPQSMNLRALLRAEYKNSDEVKKLNFKKQIEKTLFEMCQNGLHDHLAGGFHRYSTDDQWLVPHFEKMLYDNALLSMSYLEAYQMYKNPQWAQVAKQTLNYVDEYLSHPEGGFYSAQDADSLTHEGVKSEGYYYTWSFLELKKYLNEKEFLKLSEVFEITEHGNFEERIILKYKDGFDISIKENEEINSILTRLLLEREKRPRPHRDEKIITSWNALMVASFAKAYCIFKDKKFLDRALQAVQFLSKNHCSQKKEIYHTSCEGVVKDIGFSEDYAALIFALIHLYEATGNEEYIFQAQDYQEKLDLLYWDSNSLGYFRNTENDPLLILRPKETYDGVFPTVQSLSSWNLMRLSRYFLDQKYEEKAQLIFQSYLKNNSHYPGRYSFMLSLVYEHCIGMKDLVIVSSEKVKCHFDFFQNFHPEIIIAYGDEEKKLPLVQGRKLLDGSENTFYLCEYGQCLKPVTHLSELRHSKLQPA